ncbi:MAG: tRNA pseudouridine(55) synthase TruB, partial [Planctomycetota bacterium]|nr:tRNA pseudouridine(55) synthase TruB [Planctomycetota bacterium]
DIVNRVQRLFKMVKVGHAGTLDPLATGVLIVCLGPATRLVERLQAGAKEYRARFRFGVTSDTDDREGTLTEVADAPCVSREQLEAVLPGFVGEISQVPPQFSAVHVDGKRAYDLARAGKEVSLAPRTVTVSRLEILSFDFPDVELLIECGSGTYIRSIGRDLGEKLGCGAMMTSLMRTRIGTFSLDNAVSPDDLTRESIAGRMIPPIAAVAELPQFVCDESQALALVQGKSLEGMEAEFAAHEVAFVSNTGELYGMGEFDPANRRLKPTMMFLRL